MRACIRNPFDSGATPLDPLAEQRDRVLRVYRAGLGLRRACNLTGATMRNATAWVHDAGIMRAPKNANAEPRDRYYAAISRGEHAQGRGSSVSPTRALHRCDDRWRELLGRRRFQNVALRQDTLVVLEPPNDTAREISR